MLECQAALAAAFFRFEAHENLDNCGLFVDGRAMGALSLKGPR